MVFDREGEPCIACGTTVERQEVGTRRLYWCPRCQA
jgi:endonuclease-8